MTPPGASAAYNFYSKEEATTPGISNYISQVEACDGESDSQGVHADFFVIGAGTNQQIRDGDGNIGVCGKTGVYSQQHPS